MKFGLTPIAEAEGAILAHSLKGASKPHKKGKVLDAAAIADLASAGHKEITVARLEDGDLHEDAAATHIAEAVTGEGLRLTSATTGRVNLYAVGAGLVQIDVAALDALNAIDPMITIATVPNYHRADADGLVATIKIISYGVRAADVTRAAAAAKNAIRMALPTIRTATLIETTTDGEEPSPKGRHAMIGRLDRFGVSMTERVIVSHKTDAIAAAIKSCTSDLVMILTASATSDPMDVAPKGVRTAGGTVTRFGMPVDPGNLLFIGAQGGRPVIGLPGCARSIALNGADWVLERVLCGIEVTHADISAMGVGGLLKEIPTRPAPREG